MLAQAPCVLALMLQVSAHLTTSAAQIIPLLRQLLDLQFQAADCFEFGTATGAKNYALVCQLLDLLMESCDFIATAIQMGFLLGVVGKLLVYFCLLRWCQCSACNVKQAILSVIVTAVRTATYKGG